MTRGTTTYHSYVGEAHETAPPPSSRYAYSCVSYTTGYKGITDCEWIIPGTLATAERIRLKLRQMKERQA